MICTNCGARLMDSDQFCPKCGTRVIKEQRCPDCGAVLRDGTKFCHKCGRLVSGAESAGNVSDETLGIPIDAIERNILSETAAEIKADHRTESAPGRTSSERSTTAGASAARSTSERSASAGGASTRSASEKNSSAGSNTTRSSSSKSRNTASHSAAQKSTAIKSAPPGKKTSMSAPPPKKRAAYRDDDDWDDEEEGTDIITIMTVIVGCVLLIVVAVLGYQLYRQYAPKNYEQSAEESEDEEFGFQDEETEKEQGGDDLEAYTVTITSSYVNVRDNPSTSDSNILKVAQEGETYTYVGSVEGGEWYEILLEDGSTGYVFHEYASVD